MPHTDELLKNAEALISCPAQSALLLWFPSLVIEGETYATGKSLYEAQNQAAVSGSMMLVIQQQLSARVGCHSSGSPLAFFVCTEGPIMKLWLHHSPSGVSVKYYTMHFLQVCHASAPDMEVTFLTALLRIMRWAKSIFLDDIAEKLLRVSKTFPSVC